MKLEKSRLGILLLFAASVLLLNGCTTQPMVTASSFDPRHDDLFAPPADVPSLNAIHRLSEEQQAHFLKYSQNPFRAHIPAHQLVYDYLENITSQFNYQEGTFIATETFAQRRGNCMSLAVLTTALAQLAGVEIEYQLVDANPVYELAPDLAVRGVHVRSLLVNPEWQAAEGQFVFQKPGVLIDYFPSGQERFVKNLDAGEYAARFYLNLAVEQMQQANLDQSYWLTVAALQHDPASADALNTLAIIYRRKGSQQDAERIYQYALEKLPNKLLTLRNYELLLVANNRTEEAAKIRARLRQLDDPSPFSWYRGAREAFAQGKLNDAEYFYRRAIERAPYMPELRYGLAQVLATQGDYQLAQAEIEQSLDKLWRTDDRQPYKAKLKWLQRQTSKH
ncbi:MAG: tetratricopeptide repeat protein [Pseudomonadales bacterium]|jgi:Tfp pilus assembly protein PilF